MGVRYACNECRATDGRRCHRKSCAQYGMQTALCSQAHPPRSTHRIRKQQAPDTHSSKRSAPRMRQLDTFIVPHPARLPRRSDATMMGSGKTCVQYLSSPIVVEMTKMRPDTAASIAISTISCTCPLCVMSGAMTSRPRATRVSRMREPLGSGSVRWTMRGGTMQGVQ